MVERVRHLNIVDNPESSGTDGDTGGTRFFRKQHLPAQALQVIGERNVEVAPKVLFGVEKVS